MVSLSATPTKTSSAHRIKNSQQSQPHSYNRELEQLFASLPSILIGLSPGLRIRRWNPKAEAVFDQTAAEVIGLRLQECRLRWDWEKVRFGIEASRMQGAPVRVDDIAFVRAGGDDGYLGITVNPLADADDRLVGFTIIGADITDKKRLETQLSQAQKLRSVGQLAAGIAHEINTPVQYVGDNTRFLQEAFGELADVLEGYASLLQAVKNGGVEKGLIERVERSVAEADLDYLAAEIPEAIQQTLEGVRRISKIVKAMKEFSHPGQKEKTSVDINAILESTITVARNEWKYVAEIDIDLCPSLPPIPGYAAELNQVFLNMIINAAHAIEDAVDRQAGQKGVIRVATRPKNGSVEIEIKDTGCGIPSEIQARIFDPFFTTKGVGRGTGQGLAICYPVIVEKHGGSIALESEEGRGTVFRILLPDGKVEK